MFFFKFGADDVDHPCSTVSTGDGSRKERSTADHYRLGAKRKRLDNVRSPSHPSVEQDRRATSDGVHDVRQDLDRRYGAIERTADLKRPLSSSVYRRGFCGFEPMNNCGRIPIDELRAQHHACVFDRNAVDHRDQDLGSILS
jgi:hypothetical protein